MSCDIVVGQAGEKREKKAKGPKGAKGPKAKDVLDSSMTSIDAVERALALLKRRALLIRAPGMPLAAPEVTLVDRSACPVVTVLDPLCLPCAGESHRGHHALLGLGHGGGALQTRQPPGVSAGASEPYLSPLSTPLSILI